MAITPNYNPPSSSTPTTPAVFPYAAPPLQCSLISSFPSSGNLSEVRIQIPELNINVRISSAFARKLQEKRLQDRHIVQFAKLCKEYGEKPQFQVLLAANLEKATSSSPSLTGEALFKKMAEDYESESSHRLYKEYHKKMRAALDSEELEDRAERYPSLKSLQSKKIPSISNSLSAAGFHPLPNSLASRTLHLMQLDRSAETEFTRLPGVKILSTEAQTVRIGNAKHPMNCDSYLFGEEPWYHEYMQLAMTDKSVRFFYKPTGFDAFLKYGEYQRIEKPKIGAIVVYRTQDGTIAHFARIVRIENENEFIVQSKFGAGYTFEHPFHLVPYHYGSTYAIFDKRTKSAPLKSAAHSTAFKIAYTAALASSLWIVGSLFGYI